jgi:3-phosphoshikimate 1-carboxyvinyltransferase
MDMLRQMGCEVSWSREGEEPLGILTAKAPTAKKEGGEDEEWVLRVERSGTLKGGVFDLNATPDLLPVMAVTAAYARGDTALVNAAHARIKETDRIAVMAEELGKLGVSAEERPDGLLIHGKGEKALSGGITDSRGDHRIAMALAVGALGAAGPIEIGRAECAAVTYPGFLESLLPGIA